MTTQTMRNGINVTQLVDTIETIRNPVPVSIELV